MKSYRINKPMAASLSLSITFLIMTPIIADSIKRAPLPPISLFIIDIILFIGFYIFIYNTIRSSKVKY